MHDFFKPLVNLISLSNSKIDDFYIFALPVIQNILWFDIPVPKIHPMEVFEDS